MKIPVLLCLFAIVSVANAQGGHSLSGLRRYAGKYAVEKVLQNPEVRRELTAMAGSRAKKFAKYMKVQPPIDLTDGDLVAQGGYPHQVPEMCGVVVVSFQENRVYAGLFDNGRLDVYGHKKTEENLPKGLQDWIEAQRGGYIDGPVHVYFH